jgi:hypothetical protein
MSERATVVGALLGRKQHHAGSVTAYFLQASPAARRRPIYAADSRTLWTLASVVSRFRVVVDVPGLGGGLACDFALLSFSSES